MLIYLYFFFSLKNCGKRGKKSCVKLTFKNIKLEFLYVLESLCTNAINWTYYAQCSILCASKIYLVDNSFSAKKYEYFFFQLYRKRQCYKLCVYTAGFKKIIHLYKVIFVFVSILLMKNSSCHFFYHTVWKCNKQAVKLMYFFFVLFSEIKHFK